MTATLQSPLQAPTNGQSEKSAGQTIISTVRRFGPSIEKLAPRGMLADYYIEELKLYLALPDEETGGPSRLLECSPLSIAQGVMRVAQTGLSLGVTAELIPSPDGRGCAFYPRYTGLIDLALKAGTRSIDFDPVYDDDLTWDFEKGTQGFLRHKRGPRRGNLTHFFAIAELKPGSGPFTVLTKEEVEEHKQQFSNKWARTPIEEILWYGNRTTIRELVKKLPQNSRFAAALQLERAAEEGIPPDDYEMFSEAALEKAIGETPPPVAPTPEAKTFDGRCTEAQKAQLLELIEHPNIGRAIRERVELRLQLRSMSEESASLYINEMETAIHGVLAGVPEMGLEDKVLGRRR
jgi:phage RecT family recombinase